MQRKLPLIISILCLSLLFLVSTFYGEKYFVFNSTDSLPEGFYRIIKKSEYGLGDLVVFPIPDSVKGIVTDRHWLPKDGLLIKNIVGVPGDSFSTLDGKYIVKNELIGSILKNDSEGRPMPVFCKKDTVESGFLVARRGVKTSFDSRYFGALPSEKIIGVAEPFFLFKK